MRSRELEVVSLGKAGKRLASALRGLGAPEQSPHGKRDSLPMRQMIPRSHPGSQDRSARPPARRRAAHARSLQHSQWGVTQVRAGSSCPPGPQRSGSGAPSAAEPGTHAGGPHACRSPPRASSPSFPSELWARPEALPSLLTGCSGWGVMGRSGACHVTQCIEVGGANGIPDGWCSKVFSRSRPSCWERT